MDPLPLSLLNDYLCHRRAALKVVEGWWEMMLGSVQLWRGKEKQFALPEITGLPGVFRWNLGYDPFLGYMAGVLPLLKTGRDGLEVL